MHTTIKLRARKLAWTLLVGFAIVLTPQFGLAASKSNRCSVQVSPIIFPSYNPLKPSDTRARGTITFNCTQSSPIKVLLRYSGEGSGATRNMMTGASQLRYNLFLDAACQVVWGDGTGGSQFYSNPSPPANVNITVPVYARIPARQTKATTGVHKDAAIAVTIIY